MIKKITTSSGFTISIDTDVLDNMELVEALAELNENELAIAKVVNLILDEDGKRRLYDHLRTPKGNIPMIPFTNELTEIMNMLGAKN